MTDEKTEIVLDDSVKEAVEVLPTRQELEDQGVSPQEVELAEKHGLTQKEDAPKEDASKDEGKSAEEKDEFDKSEDELADEIMSGKEFSDEDMKKHKNFTPNVKALYHNQKRYRKRAQEAEARYEEINKEHGLSILKARTSERKLAKIKELLSGNPEEVTQDAINEILSLEKVEPTEEDKKSDEAKQKAEQEAFNQRMAENLKEQEDLGRSKYENFDDLVKYANEVVASNKSGRYSRWLIEASQNFDPEPGEALVDVIHELAQKHPDYGKETKKVPGNGKKTDVERVIKNSEKRTPSAAVGGGRRTVSEEDLTPDDVSQMSQDQWGKLRKETRERLLRG